MRGSASIYFVLAAVAALLVAGGARLAYIEHSTGELLRDAAHRQQTAVRTIPPRRGEVLDARGRVLAGTIRRPSLFVDPGLVNDARFAAYSLARSSAATPRLSSASSLRGATGESDSSGSPVALPTSSLPKWSR